MVPANSCKIPRVPHYSGAEPKPQTFNIHDYHVLWWTFPNPSTRLVSLLRSVPRPHKSKLPWFRLLRFRSPLLAESLLFSFPSVTEMVHFTEFALTVLFDSNGSYWVSPFGNQRFTGRVLLTVAYRSFPRPSSPRSTKAFTIRP
jgi:hypothetical protein